MKQITQIFLEGESPTLNVSAAIFIVTSYFLCLF